MSLPDLVEKYSMDIRGVLHVGAHLAEETDVYNELNVGPVVWVEANPEVLPRILERLKPHPAQTLVQALVYSEDGLILDFNVTNYDGMSSSILEFGSHPVFSPDTVFVDKVELKTSTIDWLSYAYDIKANFLNMDIQGAELHALQGATEFLKGVDYIMSEVNDTDVYVDCAKVWELDEILADFERVATYWVGDQGWGDALWIKT